MESLDDNMVTVPTRMDEVKGQLLQTVVNVDEEEQQREREQQRGGEEEEETRSQEDNSSTCGETADNPKMLVNVESNETSTSSSTTPARPEVVGSPEPNCAICLGKMENKSFTDSCFHQFCFTCLLEWSKVKAECPLCKQSFKSIVHNVRSIEDYDQYPVNTQPFGSWDGQEGSRRFRYRSTLTAERRREIAIGRLFMGHHHRSLVVAASASSSSSSLAPARPSPYTTSEFRRYIYDNELYARSSCRAPRYREAAPNFYASNPAVTHRLVPWLNRELIALGYEHQVAFLLELIMSLINRFHIHSPEFREHIRPYFLGNVDHFVHEFFNFARSPHDMMEYDRLVRYGPAGNNREATADNDVMVVYSSDEANRPVRVLRSHQSGLTRAKELLQLVGFSSTGRRHRLNACVLRERQSSSSSVSQTSPVPGPSGVDAATRASVKREAVEVTLEDDADDDCVIVGVKTSPGGRSPVTVIVLSGDEDDIQQPSTSGTQDHRCPPAAAEVATRVPRTSHSSSSSTDDDLDEMPLATLQSMSRLQQQQNASSSTASSSSNSKDHRSHRHKKHHHHHSKHKHRRHRSRSPHHSHRSSSHKKERSSSERHRKHFQRIYSTSEEHEEES